MEGKGGVYYTGRKAGRETGFDTGVGRGQQDGEARREDEVGS